MKTGYMFALFVANNVQTIFCRAKNIYLFSSVFKKKYS